MRHFKCTPQQESFLLELATLQACAPEDLRAAPYTIAAQRHAAPDPRLRRGALRLSDHGILNAVCPADYGESGRVPLVFALAVPPRDTVLLHQGVLSDGSGSYVEAFLRGDRIRRGTSPAVAPWTLQTLRYGLQSRGYAIVGMRAAYLAVTDAIEAMCRAERRRASEREDERDPDPDNTRPIHSAREIARVNRSPAPPPDLPEHEDPLTR